MVKVTQSKGLNNVWPYVLQKGYHLWACLQNNHWFWQLQRIFIKVSLITMQNFIWPFGRKIEKSSSLTQVNNYSTNTYTCRIHVFQDKYHLIILIDQCFFFFFGKFKAKMTQFKNQKRKIISWFTSIQIHKFSSSYALCYTCITFSRRISKCNYSIIFYTFIQLVCHLFFKSSLEI